jgi:predicted transcriptional regulator
MPVAAGEVIRRHAATHTTAEIGRMLGVSQSTAKVWAKALGVRCRRRSAAAPVAAHLARVAWIFDAGRGGGSGRLH